MLKCFFDGLYPDTPLLRNRRLPAATPQVQFTVTLFEGCALLRLLSSRYKNGGRRNVRLRRLEASITLPTLSCAWLCLPPYPHVLVL